MRLLPDPVLTVPAPSLVTYRAVSDSAPRTLLESAPKRAATSLPAGRVEAARVEPLSTDGYRDRWRLQPQCGQHSYAGSVRRTAFLRCRQLGFAPSCRQNGF